MNVSLSKWNKLDLAWYLVGNSEKNVHALRKIGLRTKIFKLWLLLILSNALNRSNNSDCSLRAHPLLSYHLIQAQWPSRQFFCSMNFSMNFVWQWFAYNYQWLQSGVYKTKFFVVNFFRHKNLGGGCYV